MLDFQHLLPRINIYLHNFSSELEVQFILDYFHSQRTVPRQVVGLLPDKISVILIIFLHFITLPFSVGFSGVFKLSSETLITFKCCCNGSLFSRVLSKSCSTSQSIGSCLISFAASILRPTSLFLGPISLLIAPKSAAISS